MNGRGRQLRRLPGPRLTGTAIKGESVCLLNSSVFSPVLCVRNQDRRVTQPRAAPEVVVCDLDCRESDH